MCASVNLRGQTHQIHCRASLLDSWGGVFPRRARDSSRQPCHRRFSCARFCSLLPLYVSVGRQKCLSPGAREWLDEAVLRNSSMTEQNGARRPENLDDQNVNKEEEGAVSASTSMPNLSGALGSRAKDVRGVETSGRAGGDGQEPSVLATLREKIRTIGAYGERGTISDR